jgi:hypothetical protein
MSKIIVEECLAPIEDKSDIADFHRYQVLIAPDCNEIYVGRYDTEKSEGMTDGFYFQPYEDVTVDCIIAVAEFLKRVNRNSIVGQNRDETKYVLSIRPFDILTDGAKEITIEGDKNVH